MADKFRKKPVTVEAVQWTGNNFGDIGALSENIYGPHGKDQDAYLVIKGISGLKISVRIGDWIIKDTIGVFNCLDEVFRKEYEPVFEGELNYSHTTEEDFAHFLSYAGLTHETPAHRSLMIRAFEAGRNGVLR